MVKKIHEILEKARQMGPMTIAVACAQDEEVLLAVEEARNQGIVQAILIGNMEVIISIAAVHNINLNLYTCINIVDIKEAARLAVDLVATGKAQILMKGILDTSIILQAALDKEVGLRSGNILSHVAVFDLSSHYHKLLLVTDVAMNIAPDLNTKQQIIENAVEVANALGLINPKVAILCAKEKVNPKMGATVDAAKLQMMNEQGEIKHCVICGPLALDVAVSKASAQLKNIDHTVAGDADILVCPTIEAGNILYKCLVFLTDAQSAGVIVGAKAPIVLTSRADSAQTKLNSIALSVLLAKKYA